MAIDEIGKQMQININKNKFDALIGEGYINGEKIILAKPQTYMNLSGESVIQILDFYKINLNDLIVIYDDIDIEFGSIRIKPSGSPGTHNGMRNITELIKDNNFTRIRIGIGRPNPQIDLKDFVLMKLTKEEKEVFENVKKLVYNSVIEIIKNGTASAMNLYNNKNGGV